MIVAALALLISVRTSGDQVFQGAMAIVAMLGIAAGAFLARRFKQGQSGSGRESIRITEDTLSIAGVGGQVSLPLQRIAKLRRSTAGDAVELIDERGSVCASLSARLTNLGQVLDALLACGTVKGSRPLPVVFERTGASKRLATILSLGGFALAAVLFVLGGIIAGVLFLGLSVATYIGAGRRQLRDVVRIEAGQLTFTKGTASRRFDLGDVDAVHVIGFDSDQAQWRNYGVLLDTRGRKEFIPCPFGADVLDFAVAVQAALQVPSVGGDDHAAS